MTYEVLGKRVGTFVNQQGEVINFGRLHVKYFDPDVTGEAVEQIKCAPALLANVEPEDIVYIDRDSRGRVLSVSKER